MDGLDILDNRSSTIKITFDTHSGEPQGPFYHNLTTKSKNVFEIAFRKLVGQVRPAGMTGFLSETADMKPGRKRILYKFK